MAATQGTFQLDLDAIDLPVADATVCVSGITAEVEWYEDADENLHWNVTLMVYAKGGLVPIDVTDPLGKALFLAVHTHVDQKWQGIIHDKVEEHAPRRDRYREHRLGSHELLGRR